MQRLHIPRMTGHHQQHTHATGVNNDDVTSRASCDGDAVEALTGIRDRNGCDVAEAAAVDGNAADVKCSVVNQTSPAAAGIRGVMFGETSKRLEDK